MTGVSLAAGRLSGNKEIKNMVTLLSSITHEFKNYLAAINISAELSENRLKDIRKKVKDADYLINNLQLQIKNIINGKPNTKGFKYYSMAQNIEEALGQYPFATGEQKLITLEIANDFKYNGNPVLTSHILYNLIKNSLRAIRNNDKGRITIKLETDVKHNKVTTHSCLTKNVKQEWV